ncbi:MAG: prepilin-type N-terminal cleavage/methylation domain-containing protein [Fusobacterium sp.]|nr:prepilin-type N-terminal cleavage/methylation domain-containing protein [Fusobacterium sp.]
MVHNSYRKDGNYEQQNCINRDRGGGTAEQAISRGFTMAEILLSLTIIGVVAAITLPSLTGNINERTWNTQRKALYSRFSQAIALMPALNGYGTTTEATDSASAVDTAAETFVTGGLAKVLKINNICDGDHLTDCGLASKITLLNGTTRSFPKTMSELNPLMTSNSVMFDTKAAAFETINGESIAVYYNPNCTSNLNESADFWSQPKMCANFVYDLNGSKGPNTFGKDMGIMTALYASDSVLVAPVATTADTASDSDVRMSMNINKKCTTIDSDSRLPNREELASLFYNRDLVTFNYDSETYVGDFWSAPIQPTSDTAWCLRLSSGQWLLGCTGGNGRVRCVRR